MSRLARVILAVLAATALAGCGQANPATAPARSPSAGSESAPSSTASATARPSSSATPPETPAAVDCRRVKCVALTFDDGPSRATTPILLKTLVAERVPTTFFMVGAMVRQNPELARRIGQTPGVTLGNHTMTHPMLTRISPAKAKREVVDSARLIEKSTGIKPKYFRPPYGLHNATLDRVAGSQGETVVVWSAGALDWQYQDPKKIVSVTMPQIAPGAIVLAHDIHPWTVRAVPELIKRLRAAGYTLVSLDDILGPTSPGSSHARGRH